jgi:uncharacterized protein
LLQNSLSALVFFTLTACFLAYAAFGMIRFDQKKITGFAGAAARHISILFILFAALWAVGYYLDRFHLLYSTRGTVFGAGYTDVHFVVVGLWVMIGATGILGALVLIEIWGRKLNRIPFWVGGYFLLFILVLVLLPGIIQRFVVKPNELELETPFLKHNIEFTRKAFQLDLMEERQYPALRDLTFQQIRDNQDTLENIRLWDYRPIRSPRTWISPN